VTESPDMRIGDAEREAALTALGEHMSIGRLDVDEYGDRSAKVSTARTRGELTALFGDLPEPRPRFDQPPSGSPAPQTSLRTSEVTGGQIVGRPANQTVLERVFSVLVPLSAVLAVALFFGVAHNWLVFLLPAVITFVGGAVFGDDWRNHHRHGRRRRY
jgi:Domain of unknown function (DUF1707)